MSRNVTMTLLLVLLMAVLSTTTAYPYVRQTKPDPFVQLASTLRHQQDMNPIYGYEEDATGNGGDRRPEVASAAVATEEDADDLWRLEELQRQLGRAAVLPFYGVRPQRNWMSMDGRQDNRWDGRELEGHVVRQEPVIEYGVPVVDEVMPADQAESIWYDDLPASTSEFVGGPSDRILVYDPERQRQAENELLLNTLAEYMLLYDSEKAARLASGAASASAAAALPVQDQSTGSRPTTTAQPASSSSTATVTTASPITMTTTRNQPPVQVAKDGTLMGQKEFPMMRPAKPQRKQRLTTTQGKLDFTSKRHVQHQTSQSGIRTPEDRLTRELDNLKTEKD